MAMTYKALRLDAPATSCGFAGRAFAVSDGDGHVHLCGRDGEVQSCKPHAGAVLAMATDEKSRTIVTGGDDGKVWTITNADEPCLLHEGRKWVDTVAISPRGPIAWSTGKTIHLLLKGAEKTVDITAPSSISDLTFSPDGKWLGAAVYGGALLVRLSDPAQTKMLSWAGSHLAVGFSPDGRFCVTAMLENALHVWRIDKPDEHHGNMGGYPSKPVSFVWTGDGRYMVTAGADVLVFWPFLDAHGPIGAKAGVFGNPEQQSLTRTVATRPQSQTVGVGFMDGSVMMFDRKTQGFTSVAAAADTGPVTGLTFNSDGKWLGFIREGGEAGLVGL